MNASCRHNDNHCIGRSTVQMEKRCGLFRTSFTSLNKSAKVPRPPPLLEDVVCSNLAPFDFAGPAPSSRVERLMRRRSTSTASTVAWMTVPGLKCRLRSPAPADSVSLPGNSAVTPGAICTNTPNGAIRSTFPDTRVPGGKDDSAAAHGSPSTCFFERAIRRRIGRCLV